MINEIKSIQGIGRYKKFEKGLEIYKNHLIFGFNGTGKSTLSDIFYSLSNEQNVEELAKRKTLKLEDGTEPEEMKIALGTDAEDIIFDNGRWNREYPVFVFNDHYIDDYIFVESGHALNEETVVFGNIPSQLARKKNDLQVEFDKKVNHIGDVILARKELCGALGIGKQKIKKEGWEKRIDKIATLSLYPTSKKHQIEEALNNQIIFDTNVKKIESWIELMSCGMRYINADNISYIRKLDKELLQTPKVTNKEISEHIAHYMTHSDINWLSSGMKYQSDAQHCPFCGQELKGTGLKKLSLQLEKFIESRQKKKQMK